MYRPVLLDAPTIKPVTLTEAKAAFDISYSEKDPLINGLIAAATSHLDGWTGILGRALCEQTWRQDYDGFSCWSSNRGYHGSIYRRGPYGIRMRLPLFPVIEIGSVKYTDPNGAEQTISSANYTLQTDDLGAFVQFISTFNPPNVSFEAASVRIEYDAGYEEGGDEPLPEAIRQAMLLLVRHWFDNPSAVIIGATVEKLPFAVEALLSPYRRVRF